MVKRCTLNPIIVLTGSELFGAIGLQLVLFATPLIALELFDASPMEMALLGMTESAAALLVGLLVARFIDQIGGVHAIVIAHSVRLISCALVVGILLTHPSLVTLYLFLFVVGFSSLINEAGVNSAIVDFVGRNSKSLNRANTLLRSSEVLSELGGLGLGGVAISAFTYITTIAIGSLSFGIALSISLLAFVKARDISRRRKDRFHRPTSPPDPGVSIHTKESFQGLRFIWSHEFLKPLTLTSLHFNFFSSIFQSVFVIFCVRVLELPPWALATVSGAGAVGGLFGAGLANTALINRYAKDIYSLTIALPALSILIMLSAQQIGNLGTRIILLALSEFLFGTCMLLCIVLFNTAKQQSSPDHLVGDIAATERTIAIAGEIPGFVIGGLIASSFSTQVAMIVALGGILLSPLWISPVNSWPD